MLAGSGALFGLARRFIYCVLVFIFFLSEHDKMAKREGMCAGDGSACVSQLSSSGWCCSNSRTWVKGKWPRLPLHSPSHWPFTLILVTFTMSPTCQMTKKDECRDISRANAPAESVRASQNYQCKPDVRFRF